MQQVDTLVVPMQQVGTYCNGANAVGLVLTVMVPMQ